MNTILIILAVLLLFAPSNPTCGLTITPYVTPTTFSNSGQWLYYSVYVRNMSQEPVLGPFVVFSDRSFITCGPHYSDNLYPGEWLSCYGWDTVTDEDMHRGIVSNGVWATNFFCETDIVLAIARRSPNPRSFIPSLWR